VLDQETGETTAENDLSTAHLDVAVDVGPSFSSQRAAIVRSLTNMIGITTDPQTQQVLQSLALMNMEGEGLRDAREFFRKRLVEMGVIPPTEEDRQMMEDAAANTEEDPNAVFLKAAAEEATAKATRARADVVKIVADTELSKAKAMEIMANIENADRSQLLELVKILASEQRFEVPPVPDFDTAAAATPLIDQRIQELPQDIQGEFLERLSNQ
jgi:hypothetical protein